MIISHKHKFIFLHTQKTAGSSITAAVNPYLGPWDVQPSQWEDTIQNGGRYNAQARAILARATPRILAASAKRTIVNRRLTSCFDSVRCNNELKRYYIKKCGFAHNAGHTNAESVKQYDPQSWRAYFKFAVVRNPWDHAFSYYCYTRSVRDSSRSVAFKEFLKRFLDADRPDPEGVRPPDNWGWKIYSIDDQIAVDYIARFEDLNNELKYLSRKIGVPLDLNIRAKGDVRDRSKPLRKHYDSESVELVSRIYRKEIEHFGYEPPFSRPGL